MALLLFLLSSSGHAGVAQAAHHPSDSPFRMIVTSDAEEDDIASFHRLLLSMNDLGSSVEAIIYSSSEFHWAGDPDADPPVPANDWAGVETYPDIINGTGAKWGAGGGYKAVVDNLRWHDPRYPSVAHMNGLIKVGNITNRDEYAKDTEGSNFIKQALLDDDPRPVFLQAWGGTNTIAAALRSIEDEYKGTAEWDAVYRRVVAKARLYIILDQDTTYREYIDPHWPDLSVIVNRWQFFAVAYGLIRVGGYSEYLGTYVPGPIESAYNGASFMSRIKSGPLMSSYPEAGDFDALPPAAGPHEFMSEGDSPSYFMLLPNGLRSWEDPTYGGWGGRFVPAKRQRWSDWPTYINNPSAATNPDDPARVRDANPFGSQYEAGYPQARWIPAIQEELAARSQWQTAAYGAANHPPVVSTSDGRLDLKAAPGETVKLSGEASDPDGDALVATWWQYREAGSYPGTVQIARPSSLVTSLVVPADANPGQTIHTILEVKDRAAYPMTRYARVIVTVTPPASPQQPGQPAQPGSPPSESPKPTIRRPALLARTARVDRRRRATVRLRCGRSTSARCRGTVTLTSQGKRLGKRSFSVPADKAASVRVKLSKSAYRTLARRGRLKVTVTVRTRGADGVTRTLKSSLTLRPR